MKVGWGGYVYAYDPVLMKTRRYHRMVMEEVLGRSLEPTEIVHHKDGDRTNNDPSNLELMSRGDHNIEHDRRFPGEENSQAKLTWAKVNKLRSMHRRGVSNGVLAGRFGISEASVSLIVRGKSWQTLK